MTASAIEQTREMLAAVGLPKDYHIGIVPASDTGAVEMAMWSMLGPRPVSVVHFESFGGDWYTDVTKQLKLSDVTNHNVEAYGALPDLSKVNWDDDVVFTYNGTTAGVRVPADVAIPDDRKGLASCDATSAVFAQEMPWPKLDVVTFSWQKCMGGEGAHGMLILSPRAGERLETFTPDRALPKIFRMTKGGKLNGGIFKGETINTPSMLCVEDYLDALKWGQSVGGYNGLVARSDANLAVLEKFVAENSWIDFLCADPATRSNTSVCLTVGDLDADGAKKMASLLEGEGVRGLVDGVAVHVGSDRLARRVLAEVAAAKAAEAAEAMAHAKAEMRTRREEVARAAQESRDSVERRDHNQALLDAQSAAGGGTTADLSWKATTLAALRRWARKLRRLDSEVLRPLFIGSEEVETPPPQPTAVGGENDGVQLERIPSLVRGDSALEPLDPSRVPPPAMPR